VLYLRDREGAAGHDDRVRPFIEDDGYRLASQELLGDLGHSRGVGVREREDDDVRIDQQPGLARRLGRSRCP
jgi:hypothetical protein